MCRAPGPWRLRVFDMSAGGPTFVGMWGSGRVCEKTLKDSGWAVTSAPLEKTSCACSHAADPTGCLWWRQQPLDGECGGRPLY